MVVHRARRWAKSLDVSVVSEEAPVEEPETLLSYPKQSSVRQRQPVRRSTNPDLATLHARLAPHADDSAHLPRQAPNTGHAQVAGETVSTATPSIDDDDVSSSSSLDFSSKPSSPAAISSGDEEEEEDEEYEDRRSCSSGANRPCRAATLPAQLYGEDLSHSSTSTNLALARPRSTSPSPQRGDRYSPSASSIDSLSEGEASLQNINSILHQCEDARTILQRRVEEVTQKKIALEKRIATQRANKALRQGGGPAYWGITVKQLRDFCNSIKDDLRTYCFYHRYEANTWKHVCCRANCPHHTHDCAESRQLRPGEDPTKLLPVEPNMHTVVQVYIKPKTMGHHGIRGLALSLNRRKPRKVEKFISHNWGGRFEDFVETIYGNLVPETVVFICSCAIPQNVDIESILGGNLYNTPFAQAHSVASEVLLVVDKDIQVIDRVWVVYELYLSMCKHKPVRIGLSKDQMGMGFRKAIMDKVSELHVSNTKATKDADLRAIMQEISGKEDELSAEIQSKLKEMVHNLNYLLPLLEV